MPLQFTKTKDIFSANCIDSNELNIPFYLELLHILGVEEITKSGKTIIQRKANNRDIGSFLELTMHEIALQKKTLNLDKTIYGHTQEEQIFHAALELSITWVNRMLFLKLLESQLINFNSAPLPPEGGAKNPPSGGRGADYAFLNLQMLPNFSEVFILFHKVLAIKEHERGTNLQEKYKFVPYLNSSLFEISELEQQFININALGNGNMLTVISSTVLQNHAKKLTTLDYFLRFLNSYNFSSEGKKQEVSQDNEPVINAAILGKIFEKINGYKDGAVFTPASITMYMCRRSIRMAVVQKFNEIKQWNCVSFEELKEKIENKREANAIINTLKICDPAVGSGHFLVSALNEIIAIKSELGVLFDRNNRRITDYKITVVNDELEIKEIYNDTFFVYRKTKIVNEIQLLQEALFHEKQTIIENCLFGVDINPNSVKICRLRLWIELLKNAYYIMPSPPTPEGGVSTSKTPSSGVGGLQTLPNIDINIKVGNSLISRFATDVDLKQVLKKIKYNVDDYRKLVNDYKSVINNEKKYKIEQAIAEIKNGFRTEIDTFEWRFEFPEVLSDDGEFLGFDVVIGNPPYGVSQQGNLRIKLLENLGKVPDFEIYYFFINRSKQLLKPKGLNAFIIPNTILFNVFAKEYREQLFENWNIHELLDCTAIDVFKGKATVRNVLTFLTNEVSKNEILYKPTAKVTSFDDLIGRNFCTTSQDVLLENNQNWALVFKLSAKTIELTRKIRRDKGLLAAYFEVSQGYIPYRKSDLIKLYGEKRAEEIVENREWHSETQLNNDYKQEIQGRNLTKYGYTKPNSYVYYGRHLASFVDLRFFNQKRLLIREITSPTIIACIVKEELVNDPQIICVIPKEKTHKVEFWWAILNSKLATFLHFNSSPKATKGAFPKILVNDIKSFPIPDISADAQKPFIKLVDKILLVKSQEKDTQNLENQLDKLVYDLYDLTEEEIEVVEENVK